MPGRVQLSRSGIRISKPGIEVSTAGANGLLLDISQRQGQILEHGFITMTGSGPYSGSTSIGPYSQIPDVLLAVVVAGNVQLNPPVFRTGAVSLGVGFYTFYDMVLTANSLALKIGNNDGAAVIGCTYTIFRRPQLTT